MKWKCVTLAQVMSWNSQAFLATGAPTLLGGFRVFPLMIVLGGVDFTSLAFFKLRV